MENKDFYSIGEFAKITGIDDYKLRRLDREGLFVAHHRDYKDCRYYSREQIKEAAKFKDTIKKREHTPPVILRERLGYSQKDVKAALKITTLANYEIGDNEPSLELIEDLTRFYEVPFEEVQAAFDAVHKPSGRKPDFQKADEEIKKMNMWSKDVMTAPMIIRNKAGLTRPYVSDILGIAVYVLWQYEKGKLNIPLEAVELLAQIYNVPFDDLRKAFATLRNPYGRKLDLEKMKNLRRQEIINFDNNKTSPTAMRERAGVTFKQACEILDLYPAVLTKYENGIFSLPLEVAEDMAVLYDVPFDKIREAYASVRPKQEIEGLESIERKSRWNNEDITPPMAMRQNAGFSRAQASGFVDIGHAALASYEKGDSLIPLDIAEDLATLYKVPFDDIRKAFAAVRKPRLTERDWERARKIKIKSKMNNTQLILEDIKKVKAEYERLETVSLTLKLPPELKRKFDDWACARRETKENLILELLEEHFRDDGITSV